MGGRALRLTVSIASRSLLRAAFCSRSPYSIALLYVLSWTVFARDPADSDAHVGLESSKQKRNSQQRVELPRHFLFRAVYAVFGIVVFVTQCLTLVWHTFLNRCLPFRRCSVYLRGFACTKVPDSWTVTTERFRRTALTNFGIEPRAAEFCLKLLGRSGIGEQSAFPPGIMSYPPDLSMRAAREEADFVMSNALDQLFESTGVKPKDVDILIVNCSIFSPTPSLAAMIVNKYKMRENILSYNLSGMVSEQARTA